MDEYDVERKFRETRIFQIAPVNNVIKSFVPTKAWACPGLTETGLLADPAGNTRQAVRHPPKSGTLEVDANERTKQHVFRLRNPALRH
ncbi:hypothetical protein AB4Y77_21320 [Paenarthrobacter sp. YAF11_1]|uniref:hypothetical protein n=1 Tax=Paenarthrobacter sp. YAF11_1 TaxID=3233074 RepID=UPI003F9630BE